MPLVIWTFAGISSLRLGLWRPLRTGETDAVVGKMAWNMKEVKEL